MRTQQGAGLGALGIRERGKPDLLITDLRLVVPETLREAIVVELAAH